MYKGKRQKDIAEKKFTAFRLMLSRKLQRNGGRENHDLDQDVAQKNRLQDFSEAVFYFKLL